MQSPGSVYLRYLCWSIFWYRIIQSATQCRSDQILEQVQKLMDFMMLRERLLYITTRDKYIIHQTTKQCTKSKFLSSVVLSLGSHSHITLRESKYLKGKVHRVHNHRTSSYPPVILNTVPRGWLRPTNHWASGVFSVTNPSVRAALTCLNWWSVILWNTWVRYTIPSGPCIRSTQLSSSRIK